MIDFHNHLMPGVDDGAADLDQSRAALEALRAQGVTGVITTPHGNASLAADPARLAAYLAACDAAWERLREMAAEEFPDVRLERGVEVMLDTPAPDLSEPRLRLAGTAFALVEFPFMAVPPNAPQVLFELKMAGVTPVVAHPERYSNLDAELAGPAAWKRSGALLQVNAGSFVGRYGPQAQRAAWRLVGRGLADYVCSDYHARGTPALDRCREALEAAGGGLHARLLMDDNPAALLAGRPPGAVPPLRSRPPLWKRLFGGG